MHMGTFEALGYVVGCGFHGCEQQFTTDAATMEAAQRAATHGGWRFLAARAEGHLRNKWLCPVHSRLVPQASPNANGSSLQAPADLTLTRTDIEQAAFLAFKVGPDGLALIRRVEAAVRRKSGHSPTDPHFVFEQWAGANGYTDTCARPGQTDPTRLDMALAAYGRARHDLGAE